MAYNLPGGYGRAKIMARDMISGPGGMAMDPAAAYAMNAQMALAQQQKNAQMMGMGPGGIQQFATDMPKSVNDRRRMLAQRTMSKRGATVPQMMPGGGM